MYHIFLNGVLRSSLRRSFAAFVRCFAIVGAMWMRIWCYVLFPGPLLPFVTLCNALG